MYTLKEGVGVNELIKLTEVLKEHKGRWFTANEIGKKLDVKTFEAKKKLWQLEQAGVFFNKKYELRNTEKNTVKILEKVKNADEADELYGYFSFLEIDNFEIIEYFKIMYF